MDEYQTGDKGVAIFVNKKNDFKGRITAYGEILAIERRVVLFRDDCQEYLIDRNEFTFEKKPAP